MVEVEVVVPVLANTVCSAARCDAATANASLRMPFFKNLWCTQYSVCGVYTLVQTNFPAETFEAQQIQLVIYHFYYCVFVKKNIFGTANGPKRS